MNFIICWVLFILGDLCSRILMIYSGKYWCNFWYYLYNQLMLKSSTFQEKSIVKNYKYWPWGPPILNEYK